MRLRLEEEKDYEEVENLTREAFWNVYSPGCSEHLVLHKLRGKKSFVKELDYVAEDEGKIVGNIVYSRMFRGGEMCDDIIAFGPVSVHPDYQKKGIGKALIQTTMEKAKKLGFRAVIITGNPDYYGRFGFRAAAGHGIYLPEMNPGEEAEFFMAKELEEGYLQKHSGVLGFDSCFEVEPAELELFEKKFPAKRKRDKKEGDLI